jgi:hypothetical protein
MGAAAIFIGLAGRKDDPSECSGWETLGLGLAAGVALEIEALMVESAVAAGLLTAFAPALIPASVLLLSVALGSFGIILAGCPDT